MGQQMGIWAIPGGWVEFRPLTGRDERSVTDVGLLDALALIDRLNGGHPGAMVKPGAAATLTAAARDRALAGLYAQNYGDAIASSPLCAACGVRYDLFFSLADMLNAHPVELSADDIYRTQDGARFRLPTGEDELAVFTMGPEAARDELLYRCAVDDNVDLDAVEAAMEAAAPLLNTEVEAICPECAARQRARFDMGTYLLRRVLRDKERLPSEIHMLALVYGWGYDDILSLTRAERRRHLALIESSARNGWTRRR